MCAVTSGYFGIFEHEGVCGNVLVLSTASVTDVIAWKALRCWCKLYLPSQGWLHPLTMNGEYNSAVASKGSRLVVLDIQWMYGSGEEFALCYFFLITPCQILADSAQIYFRFFSSPIFGFFTQSTHMLSVRRAFSFWFMYSNYFLTSA